jgi:trehalose 6-phosphate synthase/phosphatase
MNVVHQQKRVYGDGGEDLVAPLDHGALKSAYAKAKRRLLLLDFGGTLVPKGDYITKVLKTQQIGVTTLDLLDERAAKALEALSNDPRTTVYVVSGATMHALHALLGCYPKLGLAAANGLCTTKPSLKTYETTRRCGVADYGTDWDAVKAAALPILRRHAARTNGSSVLSRDPGVAWSYYRADPEWGRIQAVQLIGDLEAVLKPYDVSVVHLDGMIEVVPGRMHKGNVVKHILNTLDEPPDFLFACGDSKTDEKMFSSVYSHLADAPTAEHNQAYTVTVGKKASKALFYLNDHAHVIDALAKLASACEPAA